jgi:hypothetical protein
MYKLELVWSLIILINIYRVNCLLSYRVNNSMTTGLSPSLFSGGDCPTHGERNQLTTQSVDPGLRSQTPEHSDMCTGPASDSNAPKQGFRPWFWYQRKRLMGSPLLLIIWSGGGRHDNVKDTSRCSTISPVKTGTREHHAQCLPPILIQLNHNL